MLYKSGPTGFALQIAFLKIPEIWMASISCKDRRIISRSLNPLQVPLKQKTPPAW